MSEPERAGPPSILQRLRGHFLAGLIVVAPVGLTVYIAAAIIRAIDDRIRPFLPDLYNPETYLGRDVPGFGLLVFLAFTTAVGVAARGWLGRRVVAFGERQVARLPVVRSIYGALKQLAETVFEKSDEHFREVCLIQYPVPGKWAVAFVTGPAKGEIPRRTGEADLVSVFMPTTPNPTTGFLLFVPRREVVILDMSLEEAARLIVSAGLVTPPDAGAGESPARAPGPRRIDARDRPAA